MDYIELSLKKNKAACLVLILAISLIVDGWLIKGIFIPGLSHGSIRFSELLMAYMFFSEYRVNSVNKNPNTQFNKYYIIFRNFFIFFLILYLLAALRSIMIIDELFGEFRFVAISPFLIFIIASRGFKTEDDYTRFGVYLFIYAIVLSFASIQMMLFDHTFIRSPIMENKFFHTISRNNRFGSFYGNPNHFGGFLVLCIPYFLVLPFVIRRHIFRVVLLTALIPVFFALLKTYSRGSLLGLALAMSMLFFVEIKGFPFSKKLLTVCFLLFGLLIFVPNVYQGVFDRLSTISEEVEMKDNLYGDNAEEGIESSRIFLWTASLKLASEYPLFGIGLGLENYKEHLITALDSGILNHLEARALFIAEHPHNALIYIQLYIGGVAFLVFFIMIIIFYKANFEFIKYIREGNLRIENFGILSGLTGFLFLSAFDFQLFARASCFPFWMLLGVSFSIIRNTSFTNKVTELPSE